MADGRIRLKQFVKLPNVGDVASGIIVRHVSGRPVDIIGNAPEPQPHLIALGSILNWAGATSYIWGTGFISDADELSVRPAAVLATRGHLTRRRLCELGISVGPVVGDPGVFIADVLPRQARAEYELGLVPHYVDLNDEFVANAAAAGALIIDPTTPIEQFVSALTACGKILSSSLHGIVFAHSYGIPAAWVRISDRVIGNGFKFYDYYSSVHVAPDDVVSLPPDITVALKAPCYRLPARQIDTASLREVLLTALDNISI